MKTNERTNMYVLYICIYLRSFGFGFLKGLHQLCVV